MVEHQGGSFQGGSSRQSGGQDVRGRIWILVDHSAREAAFAGVSAHLGESNVEAQIVTITEVIGTMAREAIVGGAERLLRGLRVAVQGRGADEDLIGAVRRARPDVLVITNARHVRALGLLENLTGIPVLQLGVLPDYNLSASWIQSGLQAFVVAHEEQKQRLVQGGVLADRIQVAGPAIQPGFSRPVDRDAVRSELGMQGQFVVLVRAEGFDAALLEKLMFQCTLVDRPTRFIFHHNGDNTTAAALRRAADQHRMRASMFGRVDDLERYVAAADAVIVSPQEPSIAEFVAARRPLLILGDDEQFAAQIQFLVQHEVAHQVSNVVRLGSELDRFSQDERLEAMSKAAEKLVQADANRKVADALSTALANLETWRVPPQTEAPEKPEPSHVEESAQQPSAPNPFEDIGSSASRGGSAGARGGAVPPVDSGGGASGAGAGAGSVREPVRDYSGISQAEAKEQLAQLILLERDLERRLGEAVRQQERWRNRLELAREWQETELAAEAESVLRGFIAEAEPLERELRDVLRQKDKLKQAAQSPGGRSSTPGQSGSAAAGGSEAERRAAEFERRFERMEVDSDLEGLKDRIKREFGE